MDHENGYLFGVINRRAVCDKRNWPFSSLCNWSTCESHPCDLWTHPWFIKRAYFGHVVPTFSSAVRSPSNYNRTFDSRHYTWKYDYRISHLVHDKAVGRTRIQTSEVVSVIWHSTRCIRQVSCDLAFSPIAWTNLQFACSRLILFLLATTCHCADWRFLGTGALPNFGEGIKDYALIAPLKYKCTISKTNLVTVLDLFFLILFQTHPVHKCAVFRVEV